MDIFSIVLAGVHFNRLTASLDESPARRHRPPAFALLLAAVIASAAVMPLTSAPMTVGGHVESPQS